MGHSVCQNYIYVSFAQWHYHSQWGSTETWLLLIENVSQYPARRRENRRLCNVWRDLRSPLLKQHKFFLINSWFSVSSSSVGGIENRPTAPTITALDIRSYNLNFTIPLSPVKIMHSLVWCHMNKFVMWNKSLQFSDPRNFLISSSAPILKHK